MHAPFKACIKSQKKQKPPKHQAANFSETSLRNIFVPRIERLLAQGTVASPARLPGSEFIRAAPDAGAHYSSKLGVSGPNRRAPGGGCFSPDLGFWVYVSVADSGWVASRISLEWSRLRTC
jgi:hypothetical protein